MAKKQAVLPLDFVPKNCAECSFFEYVGTFAPNRKQCWLVEKRARVVREMAKDFDQWHDKADWCPIQEISVVDDEEDLNK